MWGLAELFNMDLIPQDTVLLLLPWDASMASFTLLVELFLPQKRKGGRHHVCWAHASSSEKCMKWVGKHTNLWMESVYTGAISVAFMESYSFKMMKNFLLWPLLIFSNNNAWHFKSQYFLAVNHQRLFIFFIPQPIPLLSQCSPLLRSSWVSGSVNNEYVHEAG